MFAKYPRAGEVKTRLVPPLTYQEATALYRAFLQDALEMYTGLSPEIEPVLYLAGGETEEVRDLLGTSARSIEIRVQSGAGLGERLENAFREAFDEGCPAACIIGTDHPTLPLGNVRRAFSEIVDADLVIGPADDGGYYLICLQEPHPELFRNMPYSTDRLYEQTVRTARERSLRTVELPLWYDVDDEASLRRLWQERSLLEPGSGTWSVLSHLAERLGFHDR